MKKTMNIAMTLMAITLLSGCAGAAFNKISVTANRHITIGQELMDLKEAHDKGIINDTEYMQAKKDLLNLTAQFGGMNIEGSTK